MIAYTELGVAWPMLESKQENLKEYKTLFTFLEMLQK